MEVPAISDDMENMYLTFNVGDVGYGIEIRYVQQIINMTKINVMPDMLPYMKGFITLRGTIVPVVSMRLRFNLEEIPYNDRTCIIVVSVGDKQVGLIVDEICETITIEPEFIAPSPASGNNAVPYIIGIARINADMENESTEILIDATELLIDVNLLDGCEEQA